MDPSQAEDRGQTLETGSHQQSDAGYSGQSPGLQGGETPVALSLFVLKSHQEEDGTRHQARDQF